jgi:hypothetical protein
MRALELADVLRGAGLAVVEMDGWKACGKQMLAVRGIVAHHTATGPQVKDDAVERLLRNGRSDLPGPLCQLGLRRDGTWVVIASGKANHNGYGVWGNDSLGVEAYNDGVGEAWPRAQYDSFVAGCRALAKHYGVGVKGHKETDPGRKIDPTFDMNAFRAAIDKPGPTPPTITEDFLMALSDAEQKEGLAAWRTTVWPAGTPKEEQHPLYMLVLWTLQNAKETNDKLDALAAEVAALKGDG